MTRETRVRATTAELAPDSCAEVSSWMRFSASSEAIFTPSLWAVMMRPCSTRVSITAQISPMVPDSSLRASW